MVYQWELTIRTGTHGHTETKELKELLGLD